MRHADAQHRATSDPSEGHAVEAGQREAGALLVDDGEAELAGRCGGRAVLHNARCCIDYRIRTRSNTLTSLIELIIVVTFDSKGDTVLGGVIVTRSRLNLLEDISALIETDNVDLAFARRLERG